MKFNTMVRGLQIAIEEVVKDDVLSAVNLQTLKRFVLQFPTFLEKFSNVYTDGVIKLLFISKKHSLFLNLFSNCDIIVVRI